MIINILLIFTEILFILPRNSQCLFLQSVRYAVQTHVTQTKKKKNQTNTEKRNKNCMVEISMKTRAPVLYHDYGIYHL
jgi:hypothetical protein